jgi:hypothetical protein
MFENRDDDKGEEKSFTCAFVLDEKRGEKGMKKNTASIVHRQAALILVTQEKRIYFQP